jgi:hypothetical protein
VKALAIVDLLDEVANVASRFVDALIVLSINFLDLECLHEALGFGIVIGIGRPAHADPYASAFEAIDVVAAGVLDAAI